MAKIEDILREYGPALARVARAYEADAALQQDLLQDVVVAIHIALPRLRDPARLPAFVFRIAHNRAVAHVIREKRARTVEMPACAAAETATPEQALLEIEAATQLLEAIRRLPISLRQPLVLALEGVSQSAIADILGISVNNVAVRLNRAKAKLKEILDERH